jgi:hypothetical protein
MANSNIIVGESVNSYSPCGLNDLSNRITNTQGFLNGMPAGSGITWSVLASWTNDEVWDRDFIDSDRSMTADDNSTFDAPGNAISMFSGHGLCDDYPVDSQGHPIDQHCSTSSQCTNPGTGNFGMVQTNPGSCTRGPSVDHGTCIYTAPRFISTCSSEDTFSGLADYSDGLVSLGESSNSGGWNGAGTNGGTNFVILDLSCGVRPGHEVQGLWNAFAGVHNIATLMPTTYLADAIDSPSRGAKFSARWRANSNSSIALSWVYVINDMSISEGTSCGTPNWRNPTGARGFAGCGANWAASVAQDFDHAQTLNRVETWIGAQNDANDATGAGWMTWTYVCNYDCSQFPLTI